MWQLSEGNNELPIIQGKVSMIEKKGKAILRCTFWKLFQLVKQVLKRGCKTITQGGTLLRESPSKWQWKTRWIPREDNRDDHRDDN
jgi:hypothetical protein